jgi:hypothetical protein
MVPAQNQSVSPVYIRNKQSLERGAERKQGEQKLLSTYEKQFVSVPRTVVQ